MYINCSRVKPVCQVKITDEYQITLCLSVFSVLDVYISLVHVYQPSEKNRPPSSLAWLHSFSTDEMANRLHHAPDKLCSTVIQATITR